MTVRMLGRDLTVTCGTEEMAGKPVQIPGARRPEGGPGPVCVAYVFACLGSTTICRLYKLTPSDQTQVTLQLTVFQI